MASLLDRTFAIGTHSESEQFLLAIIKNNNTKISELTKSLNGEQA